MKNKHSGVKQSYWHSDAKRYKRSALNKKSTINRNYQVFLKRESLNGVFFEKNDLSIRGCLETIVCSERRFDVDGINWSFRILLQDIISVEDLEGCVALCKLVVDIDEEDGCWYCFNSS